LEKCNKYPWETEDDENDEESDKDEESDND
jgi:hypothetical protein